MKKWTRRSDESTKRRGGASIAAAAALLLLLPGCRDEPVEAVAAPAPAPAPAPEPPNPQPPTPSPSTAISLTDVTIDSDIDMVMTSGRTPSQEILDVNGGGLGLIDYDDDGDLDLFVANGATRDDVENGPGSRLYRNLGKLRFEDVTETAGIELSRWAMGVAVGDVDGDRLDDIYVCCFGPNVLLRNKGDGTFEDISEASGAADDRWATSAAFGDLDGDGDLDLYVVNYLEFDPAVLPERATHKGVTVMAGPHGLIGQHDVVYENVGDGTFRNVTEAWGCVPARPAFGLNVTILDLDGDGKQDVFVGNDSMANFLFHNVGEPGAPQFDEMGLASGLAANMDGNPQATMGIAVGDVDGNGRPDLFTTNFANDTNTLHLNFGHNYFDDGTQPWGLSLVSRNVLGWACDFVDLDHDGDEDLLVFNGHVYPEATRESMDSPYEQTPLLFERKPRRFEPVTDIAAGTWLRENHRDRTAAFGDLDLDGDVDIVVGELNGPVRVLRNEAAGAKPDWLIVHLRDERPESTNHRGLGAEVELIAGEARQRRWIVSGAGFQSSSAPAAHFGVPENAETLSVKVTWPDGHVQHADDLTRGSMIVVKRAR